MRSALQEVVRGGLCRAGGCFVCVERRARREDRGLGGRFLSARKREPRATINGALLRAGGAAL